MFQNIKYAHFHDENLGNLKMDNNPAGVSNALMKAGIIKLQLQFRHLVTFMHRNYMQLSLLVIMCKS